MGKGSSGKKQNNAARRNRAVYKAEGRREKNKVRKAKKEAKKKEAKKLENGYEAYGNLIHGGLNENN